MTQFSFVAPFSLGANYEMLECVGEGASGVVWKGERRVDGEPVAAKILRSEFVADSDVLTRFVNERSILLSLNAPGIVKVFDLVVEGGILAIVMEYLDGQSLRAVLRERGRLSPFLAQGIVVQLLDALHAAHQLGVVHRDVKPDNIMLLGSDLASVQVKLTDFGVSSILGGRVGVSEVIGTPEYMSPEVISTGRGDVRADVYAAGIVLYELLSGGTPFVGAGTTELVLQQHLTADVPAIGGVSSELMHVVWGMLAKDPQQRLDVVTARQRLLSLTAEQLVAPGLGDVAGSVDYVPETLIRPVSSSVSGGSGFASDGVVSSSSVSGVSGAQQTEELVSGPLSLPAFSPAISETIIRPSGVSQPGASDVVAPVVERRRSFVSFVDSRLRRVVLLVVCAFVFVPLFGYGVLWLYSRADFSLGEPAAPVHVRLEGEQLPSGLSVTREATYFPSEEMVEYALVLRSAKNPISGPFLEVLTDVDGNCLLPSWGAVPVERNSAAQTSISAACGWAVSPGVIDGGASVRVDATFSVVFPDEATDGALLEWLRSVQDVTDRALLDPEVSSSAYPAQRLRGVRLVGPRHVTAGSVIPLSIVGQWPAGEDELSPLFVSPSVGVPSAALDAVVGGDLESLRFFDRCQGAVSVSDDGRSVTALFPTRRCELFGTVGNFDLVPFEFSIAGHNS